jgi:ankyrin repeat protein
VQILIDNEADPELEDKDGNTPIDLARRKRNRQIVNMLTSYAQNRSED